MNPVTRVAHPPSKPLLIFDGDCTFCRRWIARWKQITGDRIDYIPLQSDEVVARYPELPREQLESAVHLIHPDGHVTCAAKAVFQSLAVTRSCPLWLYEKVPGVAPLTELGYRVVAANRTAASWLTTLLWGRHVDQPTYFLVRWLFLRLMGLTYLFAFWSFHSQWAGLIGSNGITPAKPLMEAIKSQTSDLGLDRFRAVPTLCWISADDGFLRALSLAGIGLAVLVILNFATGPSLFLLWLIYLSLMHVNVVFLNFQWDTLLLETGLLAIIFAPARLWPKLPREAPPSGFVLFLLRWLLFRLMFSSGIVKWLAGDPTWHDLTALHFHFETQPLPTFLAWYAHHWPPAVQRTLCALMFFIELVVPFLIFLPRRPRLVAFWTFVLFMIAIALTGSYTFFNFLTGVLSLTLLDDRALVRFAPESWSQRVGAGPRPTWLRPFPRPWRQLRCIALTCFSIVVITVTSVEMYATLNGRLSEQNPLVQLTGWCAPFRSFNNYGLFRVMTTSRVEIQVEGSNDGRSWATYEFRYKPGEVRRRPRLAAPHQPRLDWQMWFAALSDFHHNPWFANFLYRLLQGKPEVLALLEKNPFPQRPPRFVRAIAFEYHFTTPAERSQTGAWWRREPAGEYCPPISLDSIQKR